MRALKRLQLLLAAVLFSQFSFSQTLFGNSFYSAGNNSCDGVELSYEIGSSAPIPGISFPVPAGLTVSGLNSLSTDYNASGDLFGFAFPGPRFRAKIQSSCGIITVSFYLPTPLNGNPWGNTGNLAAPNMTVDYQGCETANHQLYATFQSNHGNDAVIEIEFLDDLSDANPYGISTLLFLIDNTDINGTFYNYDDCDNDGVPDEFDCDADNNQNGKWRVCHNNKTICISPTALAAHLAHGDGLGECETTTARPATKAEQPVTLKNFTLSTYPNPIGQSTKIQYTVPTAANISIKVYDVTGREVGQLFKGNRAAGTYSLDYNTSKLGTGIYYCRMLATSGDKEFVITYKMVKVE